MDNNVYIRSKLGDEFAQKILFDHYINIALPITKKYVRSSVNTSGILYEDLEELIIDSFETIIYSEDIFYKTDDFFKFIYIQRIKDFFRKRIRKNESLQKFIYDSGYLLNQENDVEIDRNLNYSNGHEVLDKIVSDKRSELTEDEKIILILYSNSYTIDEISEILKICYSCAFRKLKSAQKKCKKYIKNFLSELVY